MSGVTFGHVSDLLGGRFGRRLLEQTVCCLAGRRGRRAARARRAKRAVRATRRLGMLTLRPCEPVRMLFALRGRSCNLLTHASKTYCLQRASRSMLTQVLKFRFFLEHESKVREIRGLIFGPLLGPQMGLILAPFGESFWDSFGTVRGTSWGSSWDSLGTVWGALRGRI